MRATKLRVGWRLTVTLTEAVSTAHGLLLAGAEPLGAPLPSDAAIDWRPGVLVSLLVLPLYIPLLIFGVSAIDAAIHDLSVRPHLLILGAMLVAAIPLATWAASAALRQACE